LGALHGGRCCRSALGRPLKRASSGRWSEARGPCVTGLEFHKFYFDLPAGSGPRHTTLCDVHVRILGDAALVTYVRLTQHLDATGRPATSAIEETRVWQRIGGAWKHVHFHRSAPQ